MPRSPLDLTDLSRPAPILLATLGAASLGWILIGLPLSKPALLSKLERADWPRAATRSPVAARTPDLTKAPLIFATTLGPNAASEINIALHGVAKGPRGQAALVAIGDALAAWLNLGETRDGVTLLSIEASKIVVDTALGFRTVSLDKPESARPQPTPIAASSQRP